MCNVASSCSCTFIRPRPTDTASWCGYIQSWIISILTLQIHNGRVCASPIPAGFKEGLHVHDLHMRDAQLPQVASMEATRSPQNVSNSVLRGRQDWNYRICKWVRAEAYPPTSTRPWEAIQVIEQSLWFPQVTTPCSILAQNISSVWIHSNEDACMLPTNNRHALSGFVADLHIRNKPHTFTTTRGGARPSTHTSTRAVPRKPYSKAYQSTHPATHLLRTAPSALSRHSCRKRRPSTMQATGSTINCRRGSFHWA